MRMNDLLNPQCSKFTFVKSILMMKTSLIVFSVFLLACSQKPKKLSEAQYKDSVEAFVTDSIDRYTDSIVNYVPDYTKEQQDSINAWASELERKKKAELAKYVGLYEVKVSGYSGGDKEFFKLEEDGSVQWGWGYINASGDISGTVKSGKWEITVGKVLVITVRGNSGPIVESYRLSNGKWRSGDRSLVRVK